MCQFYKERGLEVPRPGKGQKSYIYDAFFKKKVRKVTSNK